MYTYIHVSRLCYAQQYLHTWTPAHARSHTSVHTRASAHRRSRRTQRPVPHRRPGRARPAGGGAPPGRKGGAYLGQRGDRRGVPRADVRVEHRRLIECLRAEAPPAVDADGRRSHVPARMRGPQIAHAHARARTGAARARVCGGPASAIRSSGQPAAHGYSYMHALGTRILYMCEFERWMALRRERVALANMPRISASSAPARDRTRMQEHTHRFPRTYPDFATISIYTYICVHDVCVGSIYRRTYPRACARDGYGRIVGARKSHARVHRRRCSRMHAHSNLSHKCTYAYTYM
jgi:hypothetical protein